MLNSKQNAIEQYNTIQTPKFTYERRKLVCDPHMYALPISDQYMQNDEQPTKTGTNEMVAGVKRIALSASDLW